MLNKIWFWLLCIGLVYGLCKAACKTVIPSPVQKLPASASESSAPPIGNESISEFRDAIANKLRSFLGLPPAERAKPEDPPLTAMGKRLNAALLDGARTAVEICIGLIGIMALWLGLLNVAKDAGLINAFAQLVRPFMRWLFPEVPDGHAAQGAMLMNFSANMLGLDNAATPMGLKAMEELQTLNPIKDTATNSMALFLAINCGSITLIPFTIIGFRAIKGSESPPSIIGGTLIASLASVVAGVAAARWLAKSPRFQPPADESPAIIDAAAGIAGGAS